MQLRKTERTKKMYCEALLELCNSKQLAKITVGDLARETGTVRQTFYNNFRDINDLISYIPINYLKTTQADVLTTENACRAYEYALEHRAFFEQLPTHSGQNNFRETSIAITNQFLDWCSNGFAWPISVLTKAQEAALPDFAKEALAQPESEAARQA